MILECSKQGCTLSTDGKCLDGFEPENCPNVKKIENDIENETSEDEPDKDTLIYDGEALTLENSRLVTTADNTHIIILAGPTKSGKTTLVCALNYLFQKGCFSNYNFCGSLTLIGLERITFDSRSSSGREVPDTPRTEQNPYQRFYHISVKKNENNVTEQNLLFTDISGEHYENLKNSVDECKKLFLLKRADHFVLFFDCEKLCDKIERHNAKNEGLSLLKTLFDSGMIDNKSIIEIIFAKWDIVVLQKKAENMNFIDALENEIKEKFRNSFKSMDFYKIASRPDNGILELGYGMSEIFPKWVEESPFLSEIKDEIHSNISGFKSLREFLKFGMR